MVVIVDAAAARLRDALLVDGYVADVAPVALVDQAAEVLGAVQTLDRIVERLQLEAVIRPFDRLGVDVVPERRESVILDRGHHPYRLTERR
jgi:hypothetical protein